MWTAIVGIGAKFVGILVSLVDMAIKLIAYIGVYMMAWRRAKAKVIEDVSAVKDKQLKIAARPSLHRDELLRRMLLRKR